MNNNQIQCQDSAFREFFIELKRRKLNPFPKNSYNHGRHRLITTDTEKYYVIYKRAFFNTFEKQFKGIYEQYPFLTGKGESINKEALEVALRNQVDAVVFIHPEGIYSIYPMIIKSFCEKNELIRTQDKTNYYKGLNGTRETTKETTYSFPKKLMGIF
jgi:hypothetical protein